MSLLKVNVVGAVSLGQHILFGFYIRFRIAVVDDSDIVQVLIALEVGL
jgi:hypothetical protein